LGHGGVTARPVCGPPGFPRSALSLKALRCLKTSVGASLLRPGSHPTTPQCSADSTGKVLNVVVTRWGIYPFTIDIKYHLHALLEEIIQSFLNAAIYTEASVLELILCFFAEKKSKYLTHRSILRQQ
jgi:molybdopterin biosynthesis enzyme